MLPFCCGCSPPAAPAPRLHSRRSPRLIPRRRSLPCRARGHARSSGDAATCRLAARRVRACRHGRGTAAATRMCRGGSPKRQDPSAAGPTSGHRARGEDARTGRIAAAGCDARSRITAITAAPTLDLDALEGAAQGDQGHRLFTKISLKNKVDDLMKQFRDHYRSKTKPTIAELRQVYDLLMMKVLSLLQDGDQKLASAVVSSREAIWALLADEQRFAALQS